MTETRDTSAPAAKAGMLRGYALALRSAGMFERVSARVPSEVARLLVTPPPASVWVPWEETEPLQRAIEAEGGLRAVRDISRDAVLRGLVPITRTVIDGFLRLFGGTPHTLFSRMNEMSRVSTRGIEYEYTKTSEHTGTILVRYPAMKNMPDCVFAGAAGGFEAMLELAGAKGTVGEAERVAGAGGNSARFAIAWTPRNAR